MEDLQWFLNEQLKSMTDVVFMMTIHKSKGLEFDTVWIVDYDILLDSQTLQFT